MGPQPAQASPRCTKCNSPPINGQCTNHHTAVYCMMFHCSVSTGPCQATPRITWPTTVRSSPTPVSDNCVLPTLEHSLSVRHAAVLKAGPLLPQDHKSVLYLYRIGTVCHPISDYVGCHTASSAVTEDIFIRTAQCELYLTVPYKNILTYLMCPLKG